MSDRVPFTAHRALRTAYFLSMPDAVSIAAHAKANLFLRVLSKDTTGYHSIETVFTLLELADELTVERIEAGLELTVDGAETGPAEENLAYRAAALVMDATGRKFGVRIRLEKRIPVGAGLGGGSSDGAAALHAVNALAGNAVPRHELIQFAAQLGSDVAFFAMGAPMALAWGRGERMFQLDPPPAAPALLAVPPFGVNTGKAYAELDDSRADGKWFRGGVALNAEAFSTWGGIGRLGGNDFESPVFGKEPVIRETFERLAATRPLLVRLTGSGAAVIAIYKNERDREAAALEVGEQEARLMRTSTRPSPAPPPRPVR